MIFPIVLAYAYSQVRINWAPLIYVFWVFGRQFSNFKFDFHDEKKFLDPKTQLIPASIGLVFIFTPIQG